MFCATCNLHYPDHLNFCRRCGQPLAESSGEPVIESHCCTRCGARVVRGEHFCQQCGCKLLVKAQETVVGACYHCGALWRTGWLFCKSCGLDRDRALLAPVSTPPSPSMKINPLLMPVEEAPKIEKIYCEKCGSETKPFSRYCETCGTDVWEKTSGKLSMAEPGTATGPAIDKYKTHFEGTNIQPESMATLIDGMEYSEVNEAGVKQQSPQSPVIPVMSAGESEKRGNRAALQTLAIVFVVLLVFSGLAVWWLSRTASTKQAAPVDVTQTQPDEPGPNTISKTEIEQPAAKAPEGMIYIPGGTFLMGRNDADKFEAPAHEVIVKPFFIDINEVTNGEYQSFIAATGYRAPSSWKNGKYSAGEERFPVVNVTWKDADTYAVWAGKRLPTEEEWEYAARGNDGRLYPWGNTWNSDLANADRSVNGRLFDVGSFPNGASPFKLMDMCGNVWEWTSSELLSYADKNQKLGIGRVIRGGAFDVAADRATATYRGFVPPENAYDKTGFRCARDAK